MLSDILVVENDYVLTNQTGLLNITCTR